MIDLVTVDFLRGTKEDELLSEVTFALLFWVIRSWVLEWASLNQSRRLLLESPNLSEAVAEIISVRAFQSASFARVGGDRDWN